MTDIEIVLIIICIIMSVLFLITSNILTEIQYKITKLEEEVTRLRKDSWGDSLEKRKQYFEAIRSNNEDNRI